MATTPRHPTTSVLFFYVLGKLPEAHASAIDRHLRHCQRCQAHHATVENDAANLALALRPVAVPNLLRETLLHSAREVHRLSDSLPTLRYALRYNLREAQEVLRRIDLPKYWTPRRGAWTMALDQPDGRSAEMVRLTLAGSYTLAAGDDARVWVLQGHARGHASRLAAGQAARIPAGTTLAAYPGPDLLLLVVRATAAQTAPRRRAAAAVVRAGRAEDVGA